MSPWGQYQSTTKFLGFPKPFSKWKYFDVPKSWWLNIDIKKSNIFEVMGVKNPYFGNVFQIPLV
jgi:hypothetical protein